MAEPTVWRPVVGYEGLYEVSSDGQVRSLDRYVPGRWGPQFKPSVVLAQSAHVITGHRRVTLFEGGARSRVMVHRLVLEAFVGPCPMGMEGCHNDGNPANNQVDNLRWDTSSENRRDTVRHGRNRNANKTRCVHGHAYTRQNTYLNRIGHRSCLACRRAASARARAKTKTAPGG